METLEKLSKLDRYLTMPALFGFMAVERTVRRYFFGERWDPSDDQEAQVLDFPEQTGAYTGKEKRNVDQRQGHDKWVRSFELNPDSVHEQARFRRDKLREIVEQPTVIKQTSAR